MTKCTYCGKEYGIPRGLTLIMKDGKIHHLCSSKCRKNMLMGRRKVRWVEDPSKIKKKKVTKKKKVSKKKG